MSNWIFENSQSNIVKEAQVHYAVWLMSLRNKTRGLVE